MKRTLFLLSLILLLSLVYLNLNARAAQKIVRLLAQNRSEEALFFVNDPQTQTQTQTHSQTQSQSQSQTQTQTQTGQTQTGQTQTLYIGFPAELAWRFRASGAIIAQPQTDSTYVYAASHNGGIYRVLQTTGKSSWRASIGDSIEEAFLLDHGALYVGTERGILAAFDADTGEQIWKQSVEGETFSARPAVDEQHVFFVSQQGSILSLDREDGTLRWKFKAQAGCMTTPFYFDSKVFVGCSDKNFYALDASAGFVKWKFVAAAEIWGSPVAAREGVFFGSEDGQVYWLDLETGQLRWKTKCGGAVRGIPMIYFDPRLQKNAEVLFASFDNFLYSLRIKDGGRKWLAGTVARVFARMHLDRAVIFLVPFGPAIYGFDPNTGDRVGDFGAGVRIRSAPITANDRLFLGLNDGKLLCLTRQPPPPPEEEGGARAQTQTQSQTQMQTQSQTQTETSPSEDEDEASDEAQPESGM